MNITNNLTTVISTILKESRCEDLVEFFADSFTSKDLLKLNEIITESIEYRNEQRDVEPYYSWDRPNIGDLLDRGSSS